MRFYSLHFILPFVLLSLSIVHIFLLHVEGSSSPIGIENFDYVNFYPYTIIKDKKGNYQINSIYRHV